MKVALAQLNYTIGDFEGNASKIIAEINRLKQEDVDLVVFSELSVCGYYPHDLLEKKEFIAKADDAVAEIAKHCHGIAALVGAPRINQHERGKTLFNAALFLADGEIKSSHNKTLLPTYDIFDEYRHFEPNREFSLVEYKGEKIAVTICEDLWDEQPTANEFGKDKLYSISPMEELAKLNPDFVVNLSASPFSYNQEGWRKNVLITKAKKYGLPILYCNQVGAQTELVFDGGSVYIDATGEIVKELKYFEEDCLVLDTTALGEKELQPKVDYIEKIHDALVLGIRDYFKKMGFKQATLGLSGGIDSAVTVVLAVRALGAENVRVLLMPSKYSSDHSVNDARELAENLGIRYDVVNIQSAVDQFETALAPLFEGCSPDVTEENIQARARGIYMMAISNKFGHILLNTTNKSECAVGYGTLYGDMNGGLAVLGDVYKLDVFKLSRFMNKDGEVIPENTIVKPPSAELRPDQKDTDSLPEYEDLDTMLFNYIELNKSPKEIAALGYDEAVVRRVIRMVNTNEYKRFQAAPILRVSSKAFGFGRKMPLVARY
ncbi:NAD+ synthase (glutamine-hydrolysing) [Draconibacterium orientale]|jgi:NAD+ synthase (glutamine-hydrolysing)|uniref:Glutamine-dependent NAD(+) synthetase n=1 Tax=Draconibacterium orientale TaxID=1168034 RepID=X5DI22_9BACT|nr:NAD+ synthase [Draconibacterium orientale]AHW60152.1 NAD+ synthetase [Draconibacterium orientale]SES98780.1 NAD+ synthase (glutamine-hydrolysing) [Draconibacterium orientale]